MVGWLARGARDSHATEPNVVGMSAVRVCSLTATGMPWPGELAPVGECSILPLRPRQAGVNVGREAGVRRGAGAVVRLDPSQVAANQLGGLDLPARIAP
jgi:hypothetical protein